MGAYGSHIEEVPLPSSCQRLNKAKLLITLTKRSGAQPHLSARVTSSPRHTHPHKVLVLNQLCGPICNPWEVEVEGLLPVQVHGRAHSKFQVSLGY